MRKACACAGGAAPRTALESPVDKTEDRWRAGRAGVHVSTAVLIYRDKD